MCLGAMMQAGVDTVVYGMDAAPDGGTRIADSIRAEGQKPPEVVQHVLEEQQVALMREFLQRFPSSTSVPYVKAMLAPYGG